MLEAKTLNALQHAARALQLIPCTARVAILMRHAERAPIPSGQHGNEMPLTGQGEQDCAAMGDLLQHRDLALLHSPTRRCAQTANRIGDAKHMPLASRPSLALRCDAYVDDFERALPTLSRFISEPGFYARFVKRLSKHTHTPPYPHFRPPFLAAAELLAGLLPQHKGQIGLGITHDWLLKVAASHATGAITARENADFLDALFIWKLGRDVWYYHKGRTGQCPHDFQTLFVRALKNRGAQLLLV